jgi:carbon monoxide dehydrogenase subunit G
MEITDSFTVDASPAEVWALFLDVEQVAPCMPGAELTEVIDDTTWAGRVKMKLGPVTMKYAGRVTMVERDDENRRMMLRAEGAEEGGKGGATATVRAAVDPSPGGGTHVSISQDLALSGAAAQFGGRMIADVSAHLTKQFAKNLSVRLSGGPAAENSSEAEAVPALRLAVWAFFRAVGRLLRLPWWGRKAPADN